VVWGALLGLPGLNADGPNMLRMAYLARLFAVLAGVMLVLSAVLFATGPTATSKDSTGSDGAVAPYGIVTKPIRCASPWSLRTSPSEPALQNGACLILDDNRQEDAGVDSLYAVLAASCSAMFFLARRSRRSVDNDRRSPAYSAGEPS
jgi:hypothetical protein